MGSVDGVGSIQLGSLPDKWLLFDFLFLDYPSQSGWVVRGGSTFELWRHCRGDACNQGLEKFNSIISLHCGWRYLRKSSYSGPVTFHLFVYGNEWNVFKVDVDKMSKWKLSNVQTFIDRHRRKGRTQKVEKYLPLFIVCVNTLLFWEIILSVQRFLFSTSRIEWNSWHSSG